MLKTFTRQSLKPYEHIKLHFKLFAELNLLNLNTDAYVLWFPYGFKVNWVSVSKIESFSLFHSGWSATRFRPNN